MSSSGEAPGQRFLKPAYMDRSYTSMHWFKDEPWTQPDQELPYQHQNEDHHLRNIAAKEGYCIPGKAKATAQRQTQLWAHEVQDAWEAAQNLIASGFNVNIITGLLPHFFERQLRKIITLSWDRMFQDARSRLLSPPKHGFAVDYDSYFNQNSQLPSVRNIDVREYFRLYYMSGEFTFVGKAHEHARAYDVEIWNTLYKAHRLPNDPKDLPRLFMFPFLNHEDLSNPDLLRCLILNRITNHPRNFARADWEGCHLGFASKISQGEQCDNWFMGFPTEEERSIHSDANRSECYCDYPVVFKDPTKHDTESGLFDRLQKTGRIFSWGEGMTVLAVQALTLRFVVALAKQIDAELNRRRRSGLDLNEVSISTHAAVCKAHTWGSIPSGMLTFDVGKTGLVACHQFFPPAAATPWDEEFTKILRARLDEAEKYVFNLWHDPFFFQNCIMRQYLQHYGHISEDDVHGHRNALPHITNSDIDAKKAFVNDLIRRVVRWAAFNLEMWKCLADKLAALRQMAENSGVSLDKWHPLLSQTGPIRDAWIDLGFHARWFAERHAIHAADHGGLLATDSLRSCFKRISAWETMKVPVPGSEWVLPMQFYTKFGMAVDGSHRDAVDVKDHEHIESRADEVAMSALIMHVGLKDEHTIGCIGLHKLIQAMRYNRQQTHSDLGVQQMVSDDYDNIFWTGLLSLRMEAIRPFGDAIAKSTFRVNKHQSSDIAAFLNDYDRFPFENHVDENTLRMVHWSLGIAYSPFPAVEPSRPAGLVQDWLQNFWVQIRHWLGSGREQSRTLRGHSFHDSGVSVEAEDGQAGGMNATANYLSTGYLDPCMTTIAKVLREFVNDQGLGDTDIDRNLTVLKPMARELLRRFLKSYHVDVLGDFQLRTPMEFAPRAIWGLLLQQGIAPDELIDKDRHLDRLLFSAKAFRILLKEGDTLQERWNKEEEDQDGRPRLIRSPRAQRVRKKLSNKHKVRGKARMIKARPKEFLKYLDSLNINEYQPDRDTFEIVRICGNISTTPPQGQLQTEPSAEYHPPHGFTNRLRVQQALVNCSHNQKTMNLCEEQSFWRDVRKVKQELQRETQGELKRQDWDTADIILGDSQMEINYKTFMTFCLRLGFDISNREGSKVSLSWTEECRFPRPAKPTITLHIRHPGGVTRRLDNDIIGSCKRNFRDDFGLTLESLGSMYGRRGR